MLLLVMQFPEKELGREHLVSCNGGTKDLGELFHLDPKAEGEDVAIGGWLSRCISDARHTVLCRPAQPSQCAAGVLPRGGVSDDRVARATWSSG